MSHSQEESSGQGSGSAVSQFKRHTFDTLTEVTVRKKFRSAGFLSFFVRIWHGSLAKRRTALKTSDHIQQQQKNGLRENNSPQTSVKAKRRRRYRKKERELLSVTLRAIDHSPVGLHNE